MVGNTIPQKRTKFNGYLISFLWKWRIHDGKKKNLEIERNECMGKNLGGNFEVRIKKRKCNFSN